MSKFPLTETPIVCLACEDWWYHPPRSRRRFMEVFARQGNPVLFVNSIGMRRPSAKHPDFARRIARKLRSIARLVRRVEPRLHVFSPVALPFYGSPAARRFNTTFLRLQIGGVMRALGMRRPILWVGLPTYADVAERLDSRLLVFQVTDKYDAYGEIQDSYVSEAFERMAGRADVVLASSRRLCSWLIEKNEATHYLPHGVDYEHFAKARQADLPLPADLQAIRAPRLGYVGSLDQVVDHDLLRKVAEARPDWQIVLVGPYSGEVGDLRSWPNVHLLGARPPGQVPGYLKGFDVALMPWKQDEWIAWCNPIKVKEYLAAGRQVVTMQYDEVAECREWVWVAESHDAFLEALRAVIDRGERKDVEAAGAWLKAASWEEQTRKAAEILARPLGAKGTVEAQRHGASGL